MRAPACLCSPSLTGRRRPSGRVSADAADDVAGGAPLPGVVVGEARGEARSASKQPPYVIQKRFWVRGHWRRANPNWHDQRLHWIAPHLKGPELTAIVEREYELRGPVRSGGEGKPSSDPQ
jgi:hypothetical protein